MSATPVYGLELQERRQKFLVDKLDPYEIDVQATFGHDDQLVSIAQLVSSALKHSGTLARTALHLLGATVRPDHARVGWETPPAVPQAGRARRLLDRLRPRPVNTDAWAKDAPVLLAPLWPSGSAPSSHPRLKETRRYVSPDGHRGRVVVGDNNVGLVSVRVLARPASEENC